MEYTIITFIGIIILVIYLLYNILKLKEQFVPSNSSDIIDDNKLEDFIKLEFDPIDTHIKFKPVSQNKDVNIDTEPILVNILNSIRNMDEFKKLNGAFSHTQSYSYCLMLLIRKELLNGSLPNNAIAPLGLIIRFNSFHIGSKGITLSHLQAVVP